MARLLFPYQANGSLIVKDGKVIGSELIGQNFTSENISMAVRPRPRSRIRRTRPRPCRCRTRPTIPPAPISGPTSKALVDRVKDDAAKLQAENPNTPIPVDLVTTSASGLDPDITPAAALFQVPRVAKARGVPEDQVRALVEDHIAGRFLGIIGEPHVNVLTAQPGARRDEGRLTRWQERHGRSILGTCFR